MLRLSVLINNYNYAAYIEDCVLSVLPQLEAGDELIVVDDGSTDNSIERLRPYGERLALIVQANAGQAAAMNAAVARASGAVLLFLDADDMFLPGKLATIRRLFGERGDGAPLCLLHDFALINRAGAAIDAPARRWHGLKQTLRPERRRIMTPAAAVRYTDRYGYLPWPCDARTSMVCVNRAMAERIFPLPAQGARICADEFLVRGALYSGEVHHLARPLTAYRDHGGNRWLHGSASPRQRAYLAPLRDYLDVRYRAAGGSGRLDAEDAVVTSIYVREGLSIAARWRAAWARSPRDGEALLHIAGLMLRRAPVWIRSIWARRQAAQLPLPH